MSDRLLRVGVIGLGRRAGAHFKVLSMLDDRFTLIAVCDIREEAALYASMILNVNAYADIEEMLSKEKLDVCLVATPPESHHTIATVLAERKVNIIVETPIALTLQCADMMINSTVENGVLLEVCENTFRWPHERLKRRIIECGIIGTIKSFHLTYKTGSYHGIAAIRALLGSDIDNVIAEQPSMQHITESASITMKNSVIGRYECNLGVENYWEVIGASGSIRGHMLQVAGSRSQVSLLEGLNDSTPILRQHYLTCFDNIAVAESWNSMYNTVVREEELGYPGYEARKDLEALIAIRKSTSMGGVPVVMPVDGTSAYEEDIYSRFREVYGVGMLDADLRSHYTLPDPLKSLVFNGRST